MEEEFTVQDTDTFEYIFNMILDVDGKPEIRLEKIRLIDLCRELDKYYPKHGTGIISKRRYYTLESGEKLVQVYRNDKMIREMTHTEFIMAGGKEEMARYMC